MHYKKKFSIIPALYSVSASSKVLFPLCGNQNVLGGMAKSTIADNHIFTARISRVRQ